MDGIFLSIQKFSDCKELFKVGPFNRFDNSKRVELPNMNGSTVDGAADLVLSKLSKIDLKSGGYLVFVFDESERFLPDSELQLIKDCGIDTAGSVGSFDYYDEDDEMYRFLLAFQCSFEQIENAVRGKLARHFGKEPYFMAELFIVSKNFQYVVNIYDDRGLDIVRLGKK